MVQARDWTPFVEAGLLRSTAPEDAERRELLEFLLDQGCELPEMADADRRGRLFALAGDRIIRPGARSLTLAEVAERTGGDEALIRLLWRTLGLADWDSDARVASADDVEAMAVAVGFVAVLGEPLALQLARALGSALSRVAESINSIARSLSSQSSVATSGSELETARYWGANAAAIPLMGRMLDLLSRHHFDLAREHFERSGSFDLMARRMMRAAVGFVDMSGFTTATEQLGEAEFGRLVTSFAVRVDETVRDFGGRVVKFVGDAAMIVGPDPGVLANITHELVEAYGELGEGLTLHAGLAHGELLCQDGDYFGSAVNIAARLSALAGPGTILATSAVGEALSREEWSVQWLDDQPIRGIANPIATCRVRRHGGSATHSAHGP
jgi:class 3 adenylate cyclase